MTESHNNSPTVTYFGLNAKSEKPMNTSQKLGEKQLFLQKIKNYFHHFNEVLTLFHFNVIGSSHKEQLC